MRHGVAGHHPLGPCRKKCVVCVGGEQGVRPEAQRWRQSHAAHTGECLDHRARAGHDAIDEHGLAVCQGRGGGKA
ncbi:hypothetical protein ACV34H_33595, partial [Pseudomonas aeruginosa]